MKNSNLTIIIVGYNEEINLPKCFSCLEYIRSELVCRLIYVDQSSNDKSVDIAKNNWCEVYIHPNKWYADPDKKRAVETLCKEDDWCMILDCDEEITKELADKIVYLIQKDKKWYAYSVYRHTYWMGIVIAKTSQLRIFKKGAVSLGLTIHNYIKICKNAKHIQLKEVIKEVDLKYKWREIEFIISKLNQYSTIEAEQLSDRKKYSLFSVLFYLFTKPIIRFFWILIVQLNFLKWIKWLLNSLFMSLYQILIYSKIYEKIVKKK